MKTFGDIKPGDKIFLVAKDSRKGKFFKIREVTVDNVKHFGYCDNGVTIEFLKVHFVTAWKKSTESTACGIVKPECFIKAFVNIEDAEDDYRGRLIAEISDIDHTISSLVSKSANAMSVFKKALFENKYNKTN